MQKTKYITIKVGTETHHILQPVCRIPVVVSCTK